jgi:genome maintenance exonuclease 1
MKKNTKYTYVNATATTDHGSRIYDVLGMKLPSVTTILAQTKDDEYIKRWKAKVGYDEAERIYNHSSRRGTAMHKFLEKHIQEVGYEDLTTIGKEAKPMANKIIEIGLTPVEYYYGSEITLYYPGLYAGATDLICEHNGMETVVDFKQANKPKREEWIEDYFLQIAAYAMAHDYIHKSQIKQGIIMVCTPDLYYQEFKISGADLMHWKHRFLKRLDMYYEKKFDYKEEQQINTRELLEEFEKEARKK